MRCLVVLALVCVIGTVSATSVVAHLKEQIQQAGMSMSMSAPVSTSMSMPESTGSSMIASSRMSMQEPVGSSSLSSAVNCLTGSCSEGGASIGGAQDQQMDSVEDALRPVDEWLKAFRRKNDMDSRGADLYRAAQAVVNPLLIRLKTAQDQAVEQLKDSNEKILHRVEEAAVEYIQQLLKVDREKQEKINKKEELKMKIADYKDQAELNQAKAMAALGVVAPNASAIQSAIQSAGVTPSAEVVSKIAQLVQSASQGK